MYLIRIIQHKRAQHDVLNILLDTGTVFARRMAGRIAGFVFSLVLARGLGADGAEIYFLAVAIVHLASIVGRLGLDNVMVRFAAASAVRGE